MVKSKIVPRQSRKTTKTHRAALCNAVCLSYGQAFLIARLVEHEKLNTERKKFADGGTSGGV